MLTLFASRMHLRLAGYPGAQLVFAHGSSGSCLAFDRETAAAVEFASELNQALDRL
jgi:hypothetical protein